MDIIEDSQTISAAKENNDSQNSSKRMGVEATYMSDRGVFEYLDRLGISERDLDDPNIIVMDLGAGAEQDFAKQVRQLELKCKVISIDPRLGLSIDKDLSIPGTDREKRLKGRLNPEKNSLAAIGNNLPFAKESFSRIYAMYSVPYYLETAEEIEELFSEVLRVLKSEGEYRAYPIDGGQKKIIEKVLGERMSIDYEFLLKEIEEDGSEDWTLILKKLPVQAL